MMKPIDRLPDTARLFLRWGAPGLLTLLVQASPATVTDTELFTRADLDGDGRADLVLVDRASGGVRVGYQLADGVFTWAESRAGGVAEVAGVSAGRVLSTDRDALVLASPEANRVQLVDLPTPGAVAIPTPVWTPGVGPAVGMAIDIGGGGNTPHDDLFCITVSNGAPDPDRGSLHRSVGNAVNLIGPAPVGGRPLSAARTRLKSGGPEWAAVLEESGGQRALRLYDVASGVPVAGPAATALPGADWLAAAWGGGVLNRFVFWDRGGSNLVGRAVQEPNPGVFQFAPAQSWNLGMAIGQVHALVGAGESRLAVISVDGGRLRVFEFDGVSAPTLIRTLNAPAGEVWTGLAALGDGGFKAFRGSPSDRRSRSFTDHGFAGDQYPPGATGTLPAPNALGMAANVFVFDAEPFVVGQARRLSSLNAAEWSRSAQIAGNPAVLTVEAERRGTSQQGLIDPTPRPLGPLPAGGTHILVNQYRPMISVQSFHAARGIEPAEVQVQPPPGPQAGVIHLSFTARPANAEVRYRTSAAAGWTLYAGQPIPLYRDTTVECFGQLPGGDRKTGILTARYTFPGSPVDQDSDSDGVPDFVELELKTDPWVADTDGDGFDDLSELVAETDPLDADVDTPGAVPSADQRVDGSVSFDLHATPLPMDGASGNTGAPLPGTRVQVHTVQGGFLAGATTLANGVAGVQQPTASFVPVSTDSRLGLVAVSTEYHFDIPTASADKRIGRELVGLVGVPVAARPVIGYVPGNGTPPAEAQAWVAAARAVLANPPREVVKLGFSVHDTLAAVLFERKIGQILVALGHADLGPGGLTLFAERDRGSGRRAPGGGEWLSVSEWVGLGAPGWDVRSLHTQISAAVLAPGDPALDGLRQLVAAVYRVSSLHHNTAPGTLPLPVDVLRGFLAGAPLPDGYAGEVGMTGAQQDAARAAGNQLIGQLLPRPTLVREMEVLPDSFQGACVVLRTVPGGELKSLFLAPGVPFPFPASFALLPGSRVRVFAFTDSPAEACTGDPWQVITAELISVPPAPVVDANANLLPDDWECLFGGTVGDPFGDLDGDGFSNLQEYLDGTDPADPDSQGAIPVKLDVPEIEMTLLPGDQAKIGWSYPPEYAGFMQFQLMQTGDLGEGFLYDGIQAQHVGGGQFEVVLPAADLPAQFYILVQLLHGAQP